MKAIRVRTTGGPEVLTYEEVADPTPGAGHALVRIEAAGVNYIDTYQRSGQYQISLPATLGQEAAGTVVAVGPRVTAPRTGDRVAWTGVLGAYADLATVPADRLVIVPPAVTSQQAAAAMLQGMTAHYLACTTYPLSRGDTCLVHAAAGGVGLLLVQIAKQRGATVLATVSTEAKQALAAEAGADHVIRYTEVDFEVEVKRLTDGRGVDVVYDSVGRTTCDKSVNCLRRRGMLVLFGQSSGSVPPFDAQILNHKGSLFLTRPSLGHYTATRDELGQRATEVLTWVRMGVLKLRIHGTYPLGDAARAHRDLEGRRTAGKLLLVPES